jgi:ABC-type Fe3+/spermidine/putrescine transport system ATPase subunit
LSAPSFELKAVSRSYGNEAALTDVSLTLVRGQHTACVGPSGGGKSTLLRLLAGLDAPSVGSVLIEGEIASEPGRILVPPHRRRLGMVFQDLALWPNLSVLDNVRLGLTGGRLSREESTGRAREALVLCDIERLASRKPGEISGGEQQRVALARAVAVRPKFLLLDEPFSGLDLGTKQRLLDRVRELSHGERFTVMLVTHDPLEAIGLCDHAIVLEEGRLVESGPFRELLDAPRSGILRLFRERVTGLSLSR